MVVEAQIESQQAAPCCFMFTFSAQASKEQLNIAFLLSRSWLSPMSLFEHRWHSTLR